MARSKYRASKTIVDGFIFPSKLEGRTYEILRDIHDLGGFSNLRMQEPFDLHAANNAKVCRYELDFLVEFQSGSYVDRFAIESKGVLTAVASLKLKLFKNEYDIPLLLVRGQNIDQLSDALTEVRLTAKADRPDIFKRWLIQQCKGKSKRKSKAKL